MLPSGFGIPTSLGSWPITTYSPRPRMNPVRTGTAKKRATHPIRRSPRTTYRRPASSDSTAVSATIRAGSAPVLATAATPLAEMAATEALGPTKSSRDEPKAK